MTWKEWSFYSEGLRKTQIKQWEHTRAINYMLYKVNADPKKPLKTIQVFWPLPTDQKIKVVRKRKRITKADFDAFVEGMR